MKLFLTQHVDQSNVYPSQAICALTLPFLIIRKLPNLLAFTNLTYPDLINPNLSEL